MLNCTLRHSEAPVEDIAVIKRDGKLFVDAFDGSGENVVTAEQPISESGRARKLLIKLFLISFIFTCMLKFLVFFT